ncbi:hypothetical protein [Streptomyces sp. SR-10]|uniref:hypothetical protein n=1 Tax=Streptomyces sp. SR-10 TaxID=3416442 RepID=UPI003CEE6995
MNARRVSAAAGVICAALKTKQTAAGIAAALEAAGLLQSPESVASPWERAVAGLNALVDADVVFHVEPDGHISAPFSDEHIEWDLKARRWVLTRDTCRCNEPGADPYECEADDCQHPFSELNPFGAGARPVNVASAEVSRKCDTCGWQTSVWHVDDGSADQELHEHVARAHSKAVTP